MASPWQDVLAELGGQLDAQLLPRLYDAASLRTDEVRRDLDERGIVRVDPDQPELAPTADQLRASEDALLRSTTRLATLRGALAGAAGLLSVPPELAAALVQHLHLGQRLAVVYGHDPDTDAGRMLLLRAMATAVDVELPRQAQLSARLSELPRVVQQQLPERRGNPSALALQFLAARAVVSATSRVARGIPGLGAGIGALQARRQMKRRGQRMADVLRTAWSRRPARPHEVEDAVELPLDRVPPSG